MSKDVADQGLVSTPRARAAPRLSGQAVGRVPTPVWKTRILPWPGLEINPHSFQNSPGAVGSWRFVAGDREGALGAAVAR